MIFQSPLYNRHNQKNTGDFLTSTKGCDNYIIMVMGIMELVIIYTLEKGNLLYFFLVTDAVQMIFN